LDEASSTPQYELEALQGLVQHLDSAALGEEVPRARNACMQATRLVAQMVAALRAGEALSPERVHEAVQPIVDSVLRNADAFFWVASLQRRDSYLCSHAVNAAAMAAALGRHLGLPEAMLARLATGGLLLDFGKTGFPDSLLDAPSALDAETALLMREHVQAGLALLDAAGIDDPIVRDMLLGHHERWNGSGYPEGRRGTDIPFAARIAAVIDSFDAMTSERAYQSPTSRHAALQQLYAGHDALYQRELVEQFLQCMSPYPTGSLVELNTGQVGIVVAQNNARRLYPRVMLLLDGGKALYARFPVIDLMAHNEANPTQAVEIALAPEPGAYGLDPGALYLA
jgi:HD-GYP domain-containing protein (c-di-GMP phosphodiesterase class II)